MKISSKVKNTLSDALLLLGVVTITVGVGFIYLPAGLIVGGLCAVGIAILLYLSGGGDGNAS